MPPACSQGEIAGVSLRPHLDALRRSAIPTDQALVRRFLAGCMLAMKVERLCETVVSDSPYRIRVEKLAVETRKTVAEDIISIVKRASALADESPHRQQRRRMFAAERERVSGMSPEERWLDLHRSTYRLARRHGADPLQAQSFALETLHRPRSRASGPVRIGRSRAHGRRSGRRRGSRRSTGSGSRAGPDGDGDSDEPARGRQLTQGSSSPFREARRCP